MQSTKRTWYEDLLNWIKQYITNETHYELFKKLMEKNIKRINDDELLLSPNMSDVKYYKFSRDVFLNLKVV